MKSLALFDFDGTITKKDSLIEFIKYAVGKRQFYMGILKLSPMLAIYKLGLIHNQRAKESMLSYYFKNITKKDFEIISRKYSLESMDSIVRHKAIDKIRWHQNEDHQVVMVSASIECWLRPWCEEHNIELLCTKLSFSNGIFDGTFETRNCYGKEKENRVRDKYDLNSYEHIYAYGDSAGDKELLALASKRFYKPFRD